MQDLHTASEKVNGERRKQGMNPWLRFYRSALHNPKIVMLSDRQYRAWINCLLIANEDGTLPAIRKVAIHMRVSVTDAEQLVCDLVEAELIDGLAIDGPATYRMHDWATYQYASDSSAERMRKCRSRKRDVTVTSRDGNSDGDVRKSDAIESDTDTEESLVPSSVAARAKRKEQGFQNGFGKVDGKAKDAISTLTKRAEGLGLPADALIAETDRAKPGNHAAYFTKLCVRRLRELYPIIDERLIRDALWQKHGDAYQKLMNLIVTAEAV